MPSFENLFQSEQDCINYLVHLRWGSGKFSCRTCAGKSGQLFSNRQHIRCTSCGQTMSITAGSIFHRRRLPLLKILRIFWDLAAEPPCSACSTAVRLQISYSTAWEWMHKARSLMSTFPAEHAMPIHVSRVENIVFRRSLASLNHQQLEPGNDSALGGISVWAPAIQNRRALEHTVAGATQSISQTFHGISRKYAQRYFDQLRLSANDQATKFQELVIAGLNGQPYGHREILNYSCGDIILLPIQTESTKGNAATTT